MSKFLTPPSWYDKNGSEINIFDNTTYGANGPFNTAIGRSAVAGRPLGQGSSFGGVAVGCQAQAINEGAIAIGSYDENGTSRDVSATGVGSIAIGAGAQASHDGTIAIGQGANVAPGSIAIGLNANTNVINTIQLGNNNTAYTLNIGNGRMSLNIGSTAQDNWIIATRNDISISQGLYLVRYGVGSYIDLVYLMAPIAITDTISGGTYKNDWYFPFYTSPYRLTINNPSNPNNPSHPIVCSCYYLKVDKTSSASNLKITPGYYKNDGNNSTPVFQKMSDGSSVFLFKIL